MTHPVGGFRVEADESNMYEWTVWVAGPPATPYEGVQLPLLCPIGCPKIIAGGCYKAKLVFAKDYPFSPPTMTFESNMWHPNIY